MRWYVTDNSKVRFQTNLWGQQDINSQDVAFCSKRCTKKAVRSDNGAEADSASLNIEMQERQIRHFRLESSVGKVVDVKNGEEEENH